MKYLVVRIEGKETPILFGNDVDLDQVQLPWPVVSGGVTIGQQIFFTCQGKVDYMNQAYGSRGLKDEMLIRSTDYVGKSNQELLGLPESPIIEVGTMTENKTYVMPQSTPYKKLMAEEPTEETPNEPE